MKTNMKLHERAVSLCREHRRVEFALIEVLQEIDACRMYRAFGYASLFKYAVELLDLTEATAYSFIAVARAARKIEKLQETLRVQSLSVRKASRLVSAITLENADELIEFAMNNSSNDLDREIARRNPKSAHRPSIRDLTDELVSLKVSLNRRVLAKIKRAQDLLGENDLEKVLETVLDRFLAKKDPVLKSQRAGAKAKQPVKRVTFGRHKLTAEQRHEVNARDKGRCTYVDPKGRRCDNERWLHLHHIKPVSHGGSNSPDNIHTLCAPHHDLVHQRSFEIRSPRTAYSVR